MSAPGFTPVQLYRSTTAAAVPTAGNLVAGELAINLTDEKLYFENASGVVKVLAASTYVGTVTSVNASGGTTGMTFSGGPITSSGTLTLAGTLAVANGGTGTATAFTAGSVVFAGASGVYTQDNANLFWDNTNDRLGIGTATPGVTFDVAGDNVRLTRAANPPAFLGRQSQGTLAAPTATVSGDQITAFGGFGYTGAAYTSTPAAAMRFLALETFTSIANGAGVTFETTPIGSTTSSRTERMRIDASGNVMVGTTSATGLFSVAGVSYGQMIATDRFGVLGNNLYFGTGNFRYIGNGHAYAWTQANTDGADYRLLYAGNNTSGGGAVATPTERLYITAAGDVGIGTTSPSAKLSIDRGSSGQIFTFKGAGGTFGFASGVLGGTNACELTTADTSGTQATRMLTRGGTDNADIEFYRGARGAEVISMFIEGDNGRVGIGTASPAVSLDVVGGIRARGGAPGALGVNNNGYAFDASGDTDGGMFSSADGQIEFYSNAAEVMRISSAGLVGIGNTSPTVKLDVTGGIKTSRTAVTSPATSDGNIFSGTYTPTLTNVANIDIPASTAYTFQYMRVGNVVTVSGKIDVTVTGTGLTRLNVSLPISSNFSAEENCAGTAVMTASSVSINIPASIRADTTNDVAQVQYHGNLTGMAQAYLLTFTYRII